jgi:hemolysin activation/secretion protein
MKTPITLALTLSLLGSASLAIAQTSIPTQSNPGLITAPGQPLSPPETQAAPDAPAEEIKFDVPAPPVSETPAQPSPAFMLNSLTVEGNTLLPQADLDALTASYVGKEVTFDDLSKAVDGINKLYREKGYFTSQAYIPPQNVAEGTVVIQVLEGKIGKIDVSGNRYYKAWAIKRNIPQKEGEALNIPDLEKALNVMNNQENFRLKATLSPGEAAGETDITLELAERQPWQFSPTFDNQGRPYIGTLRWGTELSNQNLTGIGDRFFAKWIGAAGTQAALANYAVPLNRFGTELNFGFGFNWVNVDLETASQPDIEGTAFNYSVFLTQPLDKNRTFVADAGMHFKRISTFINHERVDRDDVRSIVVGMNFNKFDRLGRTFARTQMTFAPEWMGANTSFWKTEGMLTRLVRLPKENLLIFRAYGQMTPDGLIPAEQFQLGGAYSVRGYTEGLLIGDRGYNFSLEHRWPVPYLSKVSPWLAQRVQGAFFFDMGQVWQDRSNDNFVVGFSNKRERTLLASAGLGVRFRMTRFMYGFADWGFGLLDRDGVEPNAMPTARLHFGVRSDWLPDTYPAQNAQPPQVVPTTL